MRELIDIDFVSPFIYDDAHCKPLPAFSSLHPSAVSQTPPWASTSSLSHSTWVNLIQPYLNLIYNLISLMPVLVILLILCFAPDRKVQLSGYQYCWSEQWPGRWRHLHRFYHEGWSCGCWWQNRTWRHAPAGALPVLQILIGFEMFVIMYSCGTFQCFLTKKTLLLLFFTTLELTHTSVLWLLYSLPLWDSCVKAFLPVFSIFRSLLAELCWYTYYATHDGLTVWLPQ